MSIGDSAGRCFHFLSSSPCHISHRLTLAPSHRHTVTPLHWYTAVLKVEIGGDCQSTDGTEPSHQHTRGDLNCSRGYEFWLLSEAKKRNPAIKTFALSWGVPHWIGNGTYFSADNQQYQTQFLQCVRQTQGFDIDYIGIWNERSWGSVDYVVGLRNTLDAAGFTNTQIVIPDGGDVNGPVTAAQQNATFKAAISTIGLHYPCNRPEPVVAATGLKYWASEDYSTVADWAGGGCWGRLLVENFVRMNMTSTISWSLIWSVYPDLPYYGNGLMYAYSPWSGNYTVNSPIWTSAHFTQFTQPGWRFLHVPGGGSGTLPGGGYYATLVPPSTTSDFSLIITTLEGTCLRCSGPSTTQQTLTFKTAGGLPGAGTTLQVWQTTETAQFVQQPAITIGADSTFTVTVPQDAIVTVSTLTTAQKGSFPGVPVPPDAPFPLPYSDDFSGYGYDAMARYFSDQAGSWAVRNGSLTQVVPIDPGPNAWVTDPDPVTLIGDGTFTDYTVTATASFSDNAPVNPPASTTTATAGAQEPRSPSITAGARRALRKYAAERAAERAGGVAVVAADAEPRTGASRRAELLAHAAVGDSNIPAAVAACDASSPFQKWDISVPAASYWSNTPGASGTQLCLNSDGCGSPLIYYQCVTSGGTCCGDTCYKGLQFALDGNGRLVCAVNGQCATVAADGTMSLQNCGSSGNQTFTYNAGGSKQLQLQGSGLCMTTPQVISTYVQVCGRITGYSGFSRANPSGYCLVLASDGSWQARAGGSTLAKGTVTGPFNPLDWHTLTLTMKGASVSGSVNGTQLFSVASDSTYKSGMAALGSGYHQASFRAFAMSPA